jgi:hypothetical protein
VDRTGQASIARKTQILRDQVMAYSTYVEYLSLPAFRSVCDRVRQRSSGICEWCGVRPATEPHHVVYCRWGEIDDEFNLLDVCHECHCDLHRCKSCQQVKLKSAEIKAGVNVCKKCRG